MSHQEICKPEIISILPNIHCLQSPKFLRDKKDKMGDKVIYYITKNTSSAHVSGSGPGSGC